MLQFVALFGFICALVGVYRIATAAKQADPAKAKKSGIGIVVFAVVLVVIGVFGAPIAMRMSGM